MVFIKDTVFQHAGISWLIQKKETNEFYFQNKIPFMD